MGLVTSVKTFFTIGGQKSAAPIPRGSSSSTVLMPRTRYNYEGDITGSGSSGVMGTSIVAAVLGWIARTFPEAPLVVEKRTAPRQWEIVDDHDLAILVERPNDWYSGVALWTATILEWWMDGNAYWLKRRDSSLKPTELWYVPHWMIEPKGPDGARDSDTYITHYEYKPYYGAPVTRLLPEDVVHFRHGLDPANPRKGYGKFKSLFREIFSDEEAANFTAALLHNMGVPGIVISPSKESVDYEPSDAEVQATKEYISQNFSGDHRGEPIVMKGPVSVSQFGFSPEQMNLRELRRIPEERISGVVGVAAIVAGLGAGLDRSTFANYAEAREASYEENIIPSHRFMSADLGLQLLPDFESDIRAHRTKFDTSEVRILQEDKNAESTRLIAQFDGGIATMAEVRAKLGLDVKPEHEVFSVKLNVEYVRADDFAAFTEQSEEPEPEPAPMPMIGAPAGEEPQPGMTTPPGAETPPESPLAASQRSGVWAKRSARREERFLRLVERSLSGVQRKFESAVAAEYRRLGRAVGDIVSAAAPKGWNEPVGEKAEPQDWLDDLMDGGAVDAQVNKSLAAFGTTFGKAHAATGEVVFDQTAQYLGDRLPDGVDMEWNAGGKEERAITQAGAKRGSSLKLKENVTSETRRAVKEGIAAGDSPAQLSARIAKGVGSTSRADTIARTEVKYAQNVTSLAAYKRSKVVTGMLAFDNQTGYGDAECSARDGNVYSFADAKRMTDDEHPNGTLSWAPFVGE